MEFPGLANAVRNAYHVAPFWDDVDIRVVGSIVYQVHADRTTSGDVFSYVEDILVANAAGPNISDFRGSWMLVVQWDGVPPWPNGDGFLPNDPFVNSVSARYVTRIISFNMLQEICLVHSYNVCV